MKRDFPKDLTDAIAKGALIPFVGAGVSMEVRRKGETESAYPSWKTLMLGAADELAEQTAFDEETRVRMLVSTTTPDFYEAAQVALGRLGPHLWVKNLRKCFEVDFKTIDDSSLALARAVWKLAPNVVITTNFDFSLRWACPDAENLREWGLDDPHGYIELLGAEPLDRPAVWHLHGMVQRPHSLVLALNDYKRLYLASSATDDGRRYEAALDTLRHILRTRTLLFVGFSFADEHFVAQIEAIAKLFEGATRNHYVLVREAQREALEVRLAKLPNRCVICVSYEAHGAPLVEMLEALASYRRGTDGSGTGSGGALTPVTSLDRLPAAGADSATMQTVSGQVPVVGPTIAPAWAGAARAELDVMLLLGGWTPSSERDRDAVRKLGAEPTELERLCVELAGLPDPPIRSFEDRGGRQRFVWADPGRTWRVLAPRLTPSVLRAFGGVAIEILTEPDPALEMKREERFLAAVQGKVLGVSTPLREGIAKSLARLSISDDLLKPAHGTSRGSLLAHRVVQDVLQGDWRIWASLDALLPWLAESSPSTFLGQLETSLLPAASGVSQLLSEETPHGGSVHTGLLWALETLGWIPGLMPRVALALARLVARDPGGQLSNRPSSSLTNLLHPLLPQSNSTAAQRNAVVKMVLDREQEVGWRLALTLFGVVGGSGSVVFPSRKPQIARWTLPPASNQVAHDAGEQLEALSALLIAHVEDRSDRWSELLEPLWRMPIEMGKRVLAALVEHPPADQDGVWAKLRERLHEAYEYGESWKVNPELVLRLEEIYRLLTPADPVSRIAWLFNHGRGVPEPVEGGWQAQQARLSELRAEAVADLWKREERWPLLERLAQSVGAEWQLGVALAESSFANEVEERLLGTADDALAIVLPAFAARRYGIDGIAWLREAVSRLSEVGRQHQVAPMLANLPPSTALLDLVDECEESVRDQYWRSLPGVYGEHPAAEWERAIAGLLSVSRAGAALDLASQANELIRPLTALTVLEALVQSKNVGESRFLSGGGSYHLERVFQAVDRMGDELPVDQVVSLEIYFLPLLEDGTRGPKYLFATLEENPRYFFELVSLIWRSATATTTEAIEQSADPATRKRAWNAAYRVLQAWSGYPGRELDADARDTRVFEWATEAIRLSADAGRADTGGTYEVGRVLARVPASSDGLWPCVPARALLKSDQTKRLAQGFKIETFNSRGVSSRSLGDGGKQERALAAGFRLSADKLRLEWPEAAAVVDELADSYQHDAEREDAVAEADLHRYSGDERDEDTPDGT